MSSLCLGCSSTIPDNVKVAAVYVHGCCGRKVCAACLDRNARLATFCPMCEDAHAAFRKGPRSDVTRAGQVVFDAESALAQDEDVAPPPYTESGRQDPPASAFVLEDGEDSLQKVASSSESASASERRKATPALLRQASKASAEAEIDTAPQQATTRDDASADVRTDSLVAHRRKVDPHEASPSEPTSSRRGDGETRQYWLRNIDTLAAIAIRFGVSTHELCLLNALPRAVLSTSPHLLHTRAFILIPAHAVDQQLTANPELAASLQGPPLRSAREKTAAARRNAQAKFRATLARNAASSSKTTDDAPPDDRAARAYVALAEDEFRLLDFGEGTDADGLALPYDSDEAEDAMLDPARARRFDAVLTHALARWHMDSVWERQQRANGLDPSSVRAPAPAPAPTPPTDPAEKDAASTSAVGRWFARALNADASDAQRGEHKSRSPRHVVALSSSVKLPTHPTQTYAAHRGPVNVVRYNSLGRYLLTGGSDRAIRLWNANQAAEQAIKTYAQHSYEVHALDIARDNTRFASGGADKSVYVWDVATGSVLRRFDGFAGRVNDVRFGGRDDYGSVLAVGGFDGVVRVFDLRAQGAWRPIVEIAEAKDAVTSLSVRGDRIYSGSVDGVLRCYDLRAGELRADTLPAPITSVCPSRRDTSVVVATLDSTVRLLDTRDGSLLQTYSGHQHVSLRCRAALTTQEDGVIAGDEQGSLLGWDMVSSERVPIGPKHAAAHAKPILWLEANPDTTLTSTEIVTASADGTVKVWSTAGRT